ncbi:DUF2878 domain-containing protein [Planctomycetota bacterium]|nr:DUF2878 domain-containing protein [Planctomycetota bacterium]
MSISVLRSLVLYYMGWFGAIVFASRGEPELATAMIGVVVLFGFLKGGLMEVYLGTLAIMLGLAVENFFLTIGASSYPESSYLSWSGFVPFWMLLLWPLFMRTLALGECLGWIRGKWVIAALLGGVGGGLAYLGGTKFGALEFPSSQMYSVVTIGLAWAVVFPLTIKFRMFFEASLFNPGKSTMNDSTKNLDSGDTE